MPLTSAELAALRQEYSSRPLLEAEVAPDPIAQFHRWLDEAVRNEVMEPNAMTLSTVDAAGQPWSRTVLLKVCDGRGFTFFSNYESAKARQLAREPRCALTWWWPPVERQVNVTGHVRRTSREESERYFHTRPRSSQLGAWASRQSEVVAGHEVLEAAYAEAEARFGDGPVAVPPHWGGFLVVPESVEFWQGQHSRLHHRLRYTRDGLSWRIERLSP